MSPKPSQVAVAIGEDHTSLVAFPAYCQEQLAKERYCVPSARIMTVPAGHGVAMGVSVCVDSGLDVAINVDVLVGSGVKVGMTGLSVFVGIAVVVVVITGGAPVAGSVTTAAAIPRPIAMPAVSASRIAQIKVWRV